MSKGRTGVFLIGFDHRQHIPAGFKSLLNRSNKAGHLSLNLFPFLPELLLRPFGFLEIGQNPQNHEHRSKQGQQKQTWYSTKQDGTSLDYGIGCIDLRSHGNASRFQDIG
ncbi:hypothetical protein DSY4560 [Desulfitobacterium hafniense Y51]|uniref:Uncharacterized protein n=1 Tax=Desulfitobacterium hafniense (strain Y51) TaxID=138119 RepID=Q24NP3_DESHY|nr:hypothetical protein DSY4560 [Desulfitobacterium hafniense Y51]